MTKRTPEQAAALEMLAASERGTPKAELGSSLSLVGYALRFGRYLRWAGQYGRAAGLPMTYGELNRLLSDTNTAGLAEKARFAKVDKLLLKGGEKPRTGQATEPAAGQSLAAQAMRALNREPGAEQPKPKVIRDDGLRRIAKTGKSDAGTAIAPKRKAAKPAKKAKAAKPSKKARKGTAKLAEPAVKGGVKKRGEPGYREWRDAKTAAQNIRRAAKKAAAQEAA